MDTSTVVDSLTAQRDPIYDNDGWLSMLRSGANPPPALHNTLEQEIAGIQAEADLITEQLLVLQKQHDYLQADIQRREALLRAPIRRLPVELLMEIFHHVRVESLQYYTVEHCTPLDYYISHEEETIMPIFLPSFLFPPPHVCAWWRQITLRATELQPYVGMTSDYLSNTAPS
ncbi:hypothetical protein BD626DRAFT_631619 [Schizophyllum amplum]|uniref:F-box domain-containing protein n=1 Tax=Schizophyllum amplum TaxID=97359 RepID=A0A550C9L5_9AGAR|nr:hypothetical protein BD626DRAFT_631619 [Auriculariopsis ampla]